MATWTLTIDNRANTSTIVYVMEDDESGLITTPEDLFYPACFNPDTYNSNLLKRYYLSMAIGGSNFPPVCLEVAARGSGTLIVSQGTKILKLWTYANGVWTAKDNITKGIADRATVQIPSLEAKRK